MCRTESGARLQQPCAFGAEEVKNALQPTPSLQIRAAEKSQSGSLIAAVARLDGGSCGIQGQKCIKAQILNPCPLMGMTWPPSFARAICPFTKGSWAGRDSTASQSCLANHHSKRFNGGGGGRHASLSRLKGSAWVLWCIKPSGG